MTEDIKYCFEDQDIDEVARNLGDKQLRRLPVRNRNQKLVGIISLGDVASGETDRETLGKALEEISRKGGEHSQSSDIRH
jgi:CBS-domain-containing membrane protein